MYVHVTLAEARLRPKCWNFSKIFEPTDFSFAEPGRIRP